MSPFLQLRFLLATSNKGKLVEIHSALKGLDVEIRFLRDLGKLPRPIEDGSSFSHNARLKAQHYYRLTGIPTLADDSGLSITAMNGAPGIHSARFAVNDQQRIQKVLNLLDSFPSPFDRSAHFICCICICFSNCLIEVSGRVDGQIYSEPRGQGGFGYDPIFYYPPLGKTFAELSLKEKNQVSHRARALLKLREEIKAFTLRHSKKTE